MSAKPNFFSELKRRNVVRAGLLYIGVVWALSQGAAQLLPVFDVPNSFVRGFVITGIIGFPFWLVFAWLYELTPEGLKRESDVPTQASITHKTGRKLDFAIIGVLAVAVALLLVDRFSPGHGSAPVPNDKSIAVLPFENLSDDKSNAYFAEGIQDEILTRLAKIGALRVISRTSTQQYASKPGNLSEIARQLGVANIVEGSVQRAGDVVRVNVQLIRAAGDSHLWADIYDRKLDNLFTVQSEVAGAIASQLQAQLTHDEKKELETPLTTDPQAHDAWLRALVFFNRNAEDPAGVEGAIAQLTIATQADPRFAAAWALLSRSHASQYFQQFDHSAARRAAATAALERAVALAPERTDTQTAVGYYHYWIERDYAAAIRTFAALEAREPNNADAIEALGYIARRQGRGDEAVRRLDQAVNLDPRNMQLLIEAAWTHGQQRDWRGSIKLADRALLIAPDDMSLVAVKAQSLLSVGRTEESGPLLAPLRPDGTAQQVVLSIRLQAILSHDYAAGVAQLKPMLDQLETMHSVNVRPLTIGTYENAVGELALRAGDVDAGKRWLTAGRDRLVAALTQEPDNVTGLSSLALALSLLGDRDGAMRAIDHAIQVSPASTDALFGPLFEEHRARIQVRFGEIDAPIATLARLLKTNYAAAITVERLRLEADWDPLRGDPRFQALLQPHGDAKAAPP